MKKDKFPIPRTLLKIAECFPGHSRKHRRTVRTTDWDFDAPTCSEQSEPALDRYLKKLRRQLPGYNLSDEEIIIIAILFERFLDREKQVCAAEIAQRLYPESVERLHALKIIRGLIVKGLLDTRGVNLKIGESDARSEDKFTLVKLVESEVLFREAFLQDILGERKAVESRDNQPFRDNREFLEGWFAYVKALCDYRNFSTFNLDDCGDTSELQAAVRDTQALLERRLVATETLFPLQDLVAEEELDDNERDATLYLLREELKDCECSVNELVEFISKDRFEQHQNRRYFEPHSRLVARGIIEVAANNFLMAKQGEVRLAPDVSRRLLSREPGSDAERIVQILRGQEILELTTPLQSFGDLVVNSQLRGKLEIAIRRYEKNVDARLREWGIERNTSGRQVCDRDEAPLLMLFSGPSGTGKTFAAGAFARQLGKDLLVTDISKLLSAWVGESEQNVRRMFYLFDRVVRRCQNPPVLLLNECDQFLTTRAESSKSVDRMYHQMQNLFLEGFERMRGLLIATTNLVSHLDSAFSRRFHLKLEFPIPNIAARTDLWHKHLLPTIPLDKDVNIDYLATKFTFSGGQIDLAVRNAAIEAAVRGDALTMDDLVRACETELTGASRVTGASSMKMGFGA